MHISDKDTLYLKMDNCTRALYNFWKYMFRSLSNFLHLFIVYSVKMQKPLDSIFIPVV